jgi:type IV secretion system protein VirD4
MDRTRRSNDTGTDAALVALASGVAIVGVLWAGGALSARLSGRRVPAGRPWAGVAAFAHGGDPSAAWHAPVGSAPLYWSVTAVLILAAGGVVGGGWRLWRAAQRQANSDPSRVDGLADRHQVRAAAGAKTLTRRAATLRLSVDRPGPTDLGYYLGASKGVGCWASVEDSIFVLGPPRSGKGLHLVIPSILDAPGAVISTATRADNLTATLAARQRSGPVGVFDPQGLATGVPSALRWSPVRGCGRPQTAMIRALALCAGAGEGTESGSFWKQQTVAAVRCLLHAAALADRSPADLYRWSLAAPTAAEAVDILVNSAGAAPAWDRQLDSIISADQRQRDSVWAMVANAFAALADPHVLHAVSPGPGERFHPAEFLRTRGTLYLLGTASGAAATATLVAALIEDVVEVARRLAASSPGGRLDPPLGLILDEAANYPLPSLPALMSEGGGTGITTMAVLQSLDQARHRWGRDAAGAIWDSAIVKVVLPGMSNAGDLADLARLVGERTERDISETSQAGGGKSVSSSTRQRPILEPSALRTLTPGHALLLVRSAKPIVLTLRSWTSRSDAEQLRRDRERIESAVRSAAESDRPDSA